MSSELEHRASIALRRHRARVQDQATDAFYRAHPEWLARFGDRGRDLAHEDAGFHVDFLAGAVEAGEPQAFADYVRWARRVLSARGIRPTFLAEHLGQIGSAIAPCLEADSTAFVQRAIQAGVDACAEADDEEVAAEPAGDLERRQLLRALLLGHRRAATTAALEQMQRGVTATDVAVDLIQPALYEVGGLWQANRITVAQEHLATAIAQSILVRLYGLQPRREMTRGAAVVCGIAGERHQVGALIVADALDADGWDVRFLGADLPARDVLEAVAEHRARVVGLSATMLFNLPAVTELIRALGERFGDQAPPVLVGGAVFRLRPELAARIGAAGTAADARAAVALAARLT